MASFRKVEFIEGLKKTREHESFYVGNADHDGGITCETLDSTLQAQALTVANIEFIFQSEKIQTLIGAAKIEEIEPIWATIFAKVNF